MLLVDGVKPVSPSIEKYCQEHAGQKNAGLWSFVASFRAQQRKTKAPRTAKAAPKGRPEQCPSNSPEEDPDVVQASATAEESSRQTMVEMGFTEEDITNALEQSDFQFSDALLLLLNGLDAQRTKKRSAPMETLEQTYEPQNHDPHAHKAALWRFNLCPVRAANV